MLQPKSAKKLWEEKQGIQAPSNIPLDQSKAVEQSPKLSLKDKLQGKSNDTLPSFVWDESKSVGQNMNAMMQNKADYYEKQKEQERRRQIVGGIGAGLKTLVGAVGGISGGINVNPNTLTTGLDQYDQRLNALDAQYMQELGNHYDFAIKNALNRENREYQEGLRNDERAYQDRVRSEGRDYNDQVRQEGYQRQDQQIKDNRNFQVSNREDQQAFQSSENQKRMDYQSGENKLNREARVASSSASKPHYIANVGGRQLPLYTKGDFDRVYNQALADKEFMQSQDIAKMMMQYTNAPELAQRGLVDAYLNSASSPYLGQGQGSNTNIQSSEASGPQNTAKPTTQSVFDPNYQAASQAQAPSMYDNVPQNPHDAYEYLESNPKELAALSKSYSYDDIIKMSPRELHPIITDAINNRPNKPATTRKVADVFLPDFIK